MFPCIVCYHLAALNGLEQRVVKVPGEPCSLLQSFIKTLPERLGEPVQPIHIGEKYDRKEQECYQGADQESLEPCGGYRECKLGAPPVPYSVVVASRNVKHIVPGRQVVVERLASAANRCPVRIMAIQTVTKMHPFRDHVTQSSIVEFDLTSVHRQFQTLAK